MFEVYAQDYRITIQEIPLGNQGEDMARCLVIDITDAVNEFGSGGTVSVRNKRNGDELPYFCTNVSTVTGADAEGNVHTYIKWTLTDVDTAAAGSGFVQADYIISGTTVKTWVYKYFILPSLGITGDVPDPYEDILEEIEAQVSAVQTAAASAAASAAQASAEATRIISTTQEVVEDWLSDHIVTGYTVDDTLTISGAAADSATVGTQLRAAFVTEETSGSIASFADGADGVPLKDLVVNIQPKQASGTPSPDNVLPITGWTEANITRASKNLIPNITFPYTNGSTLVDWGKDIPFNGGMFSCTFSGSFVNGGADFLQLYKSDGTRSGNIAPGWLRKVSDGTALVANTTYTNEKVYFSVAISQSASKAILYTYPSFSNASFENCMLTTGNTLEDYEPYASTTYNISFGSAGTVYGGTLDVTTGMLTVTHRHFDLGSLNWTYHTTQNRFYQTITPGASFPTAQNVVADITCEMFVTATFSDVGNGVINNAIAGFNSGSTSFITIRDETYTDAASFKTAVTGKYAVYPLAQPVSYQLTPTEVKSLLGNNNIFADTGSVASCEYRADTKLYIEHLTDPDSDMVADANITSGSYFMVNNNLYLATANIANGGAITPGTNCTATNLAAALNAINS